MSDNVTWELASRRNPPENALVEVITPGGDQRKLVFSRNLWWLPDKSMYVYFAPTHWRLP